MVFIGGSNMAKKLSGLQDRLFRPHLNIFALGITLLFCAACASRRDAPPPAVSQASAATSQVITQAVLPTSQAVATLTLTGAPTQAPAATATSTATPDPYPGLSLASLLIRSYGGGELSVVETLAVNSYFTRTLVVYPSDGLNIYGFMNVPRRGEPPYPVVIAIHGYIDPTIYATLDYTTRYADALARAGYLVLHPNLRGYPPSDPGENLFRVGMAVDVLNLIALVKSQAGQTGPLALAAQDSIGLWGHSMGGGISTRVMTVSRDIQAVVLYGAMSGDERRNFERIFTYFSNGERGQEELAYPQQAFDLISPINFLDRVQAAVSVHHGENDLDVPLTWSLEMCARLEILNIPVECHTYPRQPHTFQGEGDQLFIQRTIEFFDRWLK